MRSYILNVVCSMFVIVAGIDVINFHILLTVDRELCTLSK
jgi:hypothetical protein